MGKTKVTIGIPLGREHLYVKVVDSWLDLDTRGLRIRRVYGLDRDVAHARNQVVEQFLEQDDEWLLFVDDDMVLPRNTLKKLLSYNVPVIAPICTMRQPPFPPVIYKRGVLGIETIQDFPADKPFTVDAVGTGVILLQRSVLERMSKPWFAWGDFDNIGRMGEDIYLSDRIKFDLQLPIWVDPTIKVGHAGSWVATVDDWYEFSHNRRELSKYFGRNIE